jgi:signal transduction histidine kinase
MQDPSHPARNTGPPKGSSLGLTRVPLDHRSLPGQTRPHHPLVSNRRAELSGALHEELQQLRNRSHDAENAKSTVLANLSHEFRTPLNAIIGFSELLLSEATGKLKNEKHREYIDDIHQSAFRLLDMVNVLLDTADVTNGLADLNCQETDLIALFSETHDVLKSTAQARNINLELDADCASCIMEIDEQRFSQAIRQFLSEAIRQARPYGTILVRINNQPHAVSISISHLINRETLQPHETMEPISDGSAIAHFVTHSSDEEDECRIDTDLSIAKAIVELHGGVFKLISAGTNGLQAELYLPRQSGQPVPGVSGQPASGV